MSTYDKELSARMISKHRATSPSVSSGWTQQMHDALADQLEAAGVEVDRLSIDLRAMEERGDSHASGAARLQAELEAAGAEVERVERDARTARAALEAANHHLRDLLEGAQANLATTDAEREKLRAERDLMLPVVKIGTDERAALDRAIQLVVNTGGMEESERVLCKIAWTVDAYRAARKACG